MIAVDPGSRLLGYAVFVSGEAGLLIKSSGVCSIPMVSHGEKLLYVFNFFCDLFVSMREEFGDFVCVFVVEKVFLGKSVSSSFCLFSFYSHIFFIASYLGCSCFDFLAVEVKKFLVGSGQASKSEVEKVVCLIFPCILLGMPSDLYDAVALGYYYIMRHPFS